MQSLERIIQERKTWLILAFLALPPVLLSSGCERVDPEPDRAPNPPPLSQELREAVTPEGIMVHARRFDEIAAANNGNRAAGTPGYDASADYVAKSLRDAGYEVTVQRFELPDSAAILDATLRTTGTADAREYAPATDFAAMEGTPTGEVATPLRPVDTDSPTSGCEAEDFSGFPDGDVALLRRGVCTFGTKARNAEEAGASAAVVFNDGEPEDEVLLGTLDRPPVGIPVLGTSAAVGEELLGLGGSSIVRLSVAEGAGTTTNVIAETAGGDADNTLMLGAHLDSVPQGPGINDNGSGSATILEIALQLAEIDAEPRNRVRFAFWGAEEIGLVGSTHYVEGLGDGEIEAIQAYLNFDMVGSPNFVRSVYEGPDEIEEVFDDYFESQGIETETNSALDGRSDHGPFQDEGIPTGGLFSGAGGTKSEAQAEEFGGEAGAPYDPCYHERCDGVENLDEGAIDQFSDAAAHAAAVLAQRPAE
jgi:Zn-dependent M28 family amino/carboxypeptidase